MRSKCMTRSARVNNDTFFRISLWLQLGSPNEYSEQTVDWVVEWENTTNKQATGMTSGDSAHYAMGLIHLLNLLVKVLIDN
jgi:hypothetical protein